MFTEDEVSTTIIVMLQSIQIQMNKPLYNAFKYRDRCFMATK